MNISIGANQRLRLFKDPLYALVCLSGFLATFGNGLIYVVSSWFAYEEKGSIAGIAIMMLLLWSPGILFGPIIGVITDRFNKRIIVAVSNGVRGLAVVGFCLLTWLGGKPNIFGLVTIVGLFVSFYMPAVIPLITSILPKENFVLANSTIDIAYEIGTVSGMAASGILIALVGGTGTLMCGGVIFCISTCAILAIKYTEPDKVRKKKQGIVGEYLAALKYLLTTHSLLGLYVVQTFVNILLMTIPIMLVPYVREILHGGQGVFSAFELAYSAGILVGCFGVVQMSQRWGFKKSAMGLIAGVCAGLAILAASTSIALSLCAYFVAGICLSCWSLVLSQTQEKTDLQFQGRLQSLSSSLSGMFILAIYLVLTFRTNWIGIAQMYYVQAVCAGAVVILLGLMMQQKSLR